MDKKQETIDIIETALARIYGVLEWTQAVEDIEDAKVDLKQVHSRLDTIEERLDEFEKSIFG